MTLLSSSVKSTYGHRFAATHGKHRSGLLACHTAAKVHRLDSWPSVESGGPGQIFLTASSLAQENMSQSSSCLLSPWSVVI